VLLSGLAMPRIWFRFKREKTLASQQGSASPVLVYGANASGVALANWLTYGQEKRVLAFFDDEAKFHGKQLMGLPVLSRTNDILTFQAAHKACEIWVARQLSEEPKINIANFCRSQKIKLVMMSEIGH